jgi:hypothetical protein
MTVETPRGAHRPDVARQQLRAYLCALAARANAGSLFELRARYGQSMRRRFIAVEPVDEAVAAILRLACERDVYLGAAPRSFPRGGRDAITALAALWVDADTPASIAALSAFEPAPSILISSGGGQHAYWLLDHTVDPAVAEDANRRLAALLGADARCADAPRILRPPHTFNYGYRPRRPVELLRFDRARLELGFIVAGLPTVPAPASSGVRVARPIGGDPLLALDPAFYVGELLSIAVGRNRKVTCPFHRDAHPSLHVYPTAAQGWHCFSCGRGGTVYDLAAALRGVEPRGQDFVRLRSWLRRRLLRAM